MPNGVIRKRQSRKERQDTTQKTIE